jgi:hypothetical protein
VSRFLLKFNEPAEVSDLRAKACDRRDALREEFDRKGPRGMGAAARAELRGAERILDNIDKGHHVADERAFDIARSLWGGK